MFKSVLREAIIKKDIFLQKSFITRFHTSTFFSSKNQKKTGTKKGSQGGGPPSTSVRFTPTKVFVLFPYFYTLCAVKGGKVHG